MNLQTACSACLTKHMVFVADNGALYVWGDNEFGALGLGDHIHRHTPVKLTLPTTESDIISVGCGEQHTANTAQLVLMRDNKIWGWGNNRTGQLALGKPGSTELDGKEVSDQYTTPQLIPIPDEERLVQVSCGGEFSCVVCADGSLWVWGNNSDGQLGLGDREFRYSPEKLVLPSKVKQVCCGWFHAVALTEEGTIYVWGKNEDGKLGLGDSETRESPVLHPIKNVKRLTVGGHHTMIITDDESCYGWGWNSRYCLGLGFTGDKFHPEKISENEIAEVSGGWGHSVALTTDGKLVAWGYNSNFQAGQDPACADIKTPTPVPVPELRPGAKICSFGANHTSSYLLDQDGKLYLWGGVYNGKLGRGEEVMDRWEPKAIEGLKFRMPRDSVEGKWREGGGRWIFLGRKNNESILWRLPDEIVYHYVSILWGI